jgi:excisionase family DNA binding protein
VRRLQLLWGTDSFVGWGDSTLFVNSREDEFHYVQRNFYHLHTARAIPCHLVPMRLNWTTKGFSPPRRVGASLESDCPSMSRYPSPAPNPAGPAQTVSTASLRATIPTPPRRPGSRLLSTKQAAEYLGVSQNTIRKYRDEGKIRAVRVGEKLVKYDPEDLDRFTSEFSR